MTRCSPQTIECNHGKEMSSQAFHRAHDGQHLLTGQRSIQSSSESNHYNHYHFGLNLLPNKRIIDKYAVRTINMKHGSINIDQLGLYHAKYH